MKRLLFALYLMGHATTAWAYDVTISNDYGGPIMPYVHRAAVLSALHARVRLDGECASACLIILQEQWHLDICATENAVLLFHMPYATYEGVPVVNAAQIQQSVSDWYTFWLGTFNDALDWILLQATIEGLIPNPSVDGNTTTALAIPGKEVLPLCEPQTERQWSK